MRKLLVPLVLEQILSGFMGIVDTMMVTRVGDTALSAVSCVDAINTLLFYLLSALANGGTIVCSQYLGRKDRASAERAGAQVFLVSFSLSTALTVLFLIFRAGLLSLIFGQVEPVIMTQALQYFRITALSYPFLALAQTSAAQFRAAGNARLPMLTALGANLINVGGNAWLIFGCGLGVTGAALATLASRVVQAVVLLAFQHRSDQVIPFRNYRTIRPDRALIGMICRVAVPNALEYSLFQLGRLL
ncbi:MAG: polysaccharide biosynthesis C-terminal domain-containing protein, partial [Oscillospiraceae bacterium]|nr:polysaccharide biosynthesis C-terminal domain-containing protein [Oscillospiraceae bacterium]